MILHKVNPDHRLRAQTSGAPVASAAVPATSTTINLTRPLTNGGRTLLKITRVVLRNDDKELETYALMDGGSQ